MPVKPLASTPNHFPVQSAQNVAANPPVKTEPQSKPYRNTTQKVLLGMTAACGLLSMFAPLRPGASLAMRAIAFTSVALAKTPDGIEGPLIKAAKLTAVAMGAIGLVAAAPMLMVASLAMDLGLQVLEGARALYQGEYTKAAMHATFLVIDTLALAGLVVGSWQLMVAAAAVSAFAMVLLASGAVASRHEDDMVSYLALCVANIATAMTIGEMTRPAKTVVIKNDDPTGKLIVIGGKAGSIESAPGQDITIDRNSYGSYRVLHVSSTGDTRMEIFPVPTEVFQAPISQQDMPALPFGGPALAAVEGNIPNLKRGNEGA